MTRQHPDATRRAQKIRPVTDAERASQGTPFVHIKHFRRRLLVGLALPFVLGEMLAPAAVAAPQAQASLVMFAIEPGSLDAALAAFAIQSGRPLVYTPDLVAGLQSTGLRGRLSPDEAIVKLLAGAPIEIHRGGLKGFVLKRRTTPAAYSAPPADLFTQSPIEPSASDVVQLDAVVVTGSLIRGAGEGTSPVISLDRDTIDRTGRGSLADALNALPQSFGGMSSPATALINSDRTGSNDGMATGVNLRALGSSATLVLLNGRRMAGTGAKGNFADVSAIPVGAVERVEVLLDGASALYGSDAVGGVVNVILRQNFEGAESLARASIAQGGYARETQLGQTLGQGWASGHVVVSAEFYRRDALPASARDFTASSDLRPLGGADHRLVYAHPGNILDWDPTVGGFAVKYAIPQNQNGSALKPGDLIAGATNLGEPRQGSNTLPSQERVSFYSSLRQSLGATELSVEGLYSRRRFAYDAANASTILSVTADNRYFVSPDGAASSLIGYNFTDELGATRTSGVTKSLGVNAGLTRDFGSSWRAEVYAAFARDQMRSYQGNQLNSLFLDEALGAIADVPATPFSAARDGYFNPYGAGGANKATVLDFIASGWIRNKRTNDVSSLNVKADGTLLSLPAGPVKIAVGGQVRDEDFVSTTTALTSRAAPRTTGGEHFDRQIQAGFVEVRVPLISPAQGVAGVRRLELSAAGRIEHYSDAGTTKNPKIGLLWEPVSAIKARVSYGTSFRAPTLADIHETPTVGATFLKTASGSSLILLEAGGNPDLRPETAKTWTAGFDFNFPGRAGARLGLSYFDTKFSNQVGHPIYDDLSNALLNPIYGSFVRQLDPTSAADTAAAQALIDASSSPDPKLFPATAYRAILDGRYVNAGDLTVRGIDLDATWPLAIGPDQIVLSANATYLMDYRRKVTPDAPSVQFVDTAGMPVDLRANLSAAWTHGPFSTALTVRYVDDYKITGGGSVDAWTTADLQVRWTAPATSGPLRGLIAAVSAQNLFAVDPPFYDAVQGVGYDPANADPIGRVVAVQLTKRW